VNSLRARLRNRRPAAVSLSSCQIAKAYSAGEYEDGHAITLVFDEKHDTPPERAGILYAISSRSLMAFVGVALLEFMITSCESGGEGIQWRP
jgi:hypothetical protein